MDPEPRYVEDPFEEDLPPLYGSKRAKWMEPQSEFEKMVLGAFGMHFYPHKRVGERTTGSREMRSKLIEIGKSMVSLESGLESVYPTEWVMAVLEWYRSRERMGWMALRSFLKSLHNTQWRDDFIAKWKAEHQKYAASPKDKEDFSKYLEMPDPNADYKKYLRSLNEQCKSEDD
jgi:hypothetical protein